VSASPLPPVVALEVAGTEDDMRSVLDGVGDGDANVVNGTELSTTRRMRIALTV
jgi:hypothetical protein